MTRATRAVAAGLAVAAFAAGCGGSSSPSGNPTGPRAASKGPEAKPAVLPPHSWSGLGAPLTRFASAHPAQGGGGFGRGPAGRKCCEFVALTTTGPPDNEVNGYLQELATGTPLATAKLQVLALMPSDTTTVAFWNQRDSGGRMCALWNLRSATLGRWFDTKYFGDRRGVMRVILRTVHTAQVFDASNVTQAIVSTGANSHHTRC